MCAATTTTQAPVTTTTQAPVTTTTQAPVTTTTQAPVTTTTTAAPAPTIKSVKKGLGYDYTSPKFDSWAATGAIGWVYNW